MPHAVLITVLCCLPAAGFLLALWLTDVNREPDNGIAQEQEDEPRQSPDDLLAVAA